MKKFLILASAVIVNAALCTTVFGAEDGVSVVVDGNTVEFDQPAIIEDSRVLVPFRGVYEALGAEVSWNADENKVTAVKGDTVVNITIGENALYKNDTKLETDVPAVIKNGRTLVPLRAVSEAMDNAVAWNADTKTVLVSSDWDIYFAQPIPQDIRDKMWNVTMRENPHIGYDDISYLTVTYYGYDNKPHLGNIIVNKALAEDALEIFKELYEVKFPIEKMEPAYVYGGDDETSMRANNTSAFNYRNIANSENISNHALGCAIDINPLINPYVNGDFIQPATAEKYIDRNSGETGVITADGDCVRIFKEHNWEWGGDWDTPKDYQHFEKKID